MKLNEEKLDKYLRALSRRVINGRTTTYEDEKILIDVARFGLSILTEDKESEVNHETRQEETQIL